MIHDKDKGEKEEIYLSTYAAVHLYVYFNEEENNFLNYILTISARLVAAGSIQAQ